MAADINFYGLVCGQVIRKNLQHLFKGQHLSLIHISYQSGQLDNCYSHMEKRGSRYLRYALYNATKYVCHWDESFGTYLAKKRAEGKHYNVALSHATKKLVRTIYAMEKTGQSYSSAS